MKLNSVRNFFSYVCMFATIGFSIMSTIIYGYTIYYYAVNNGFGRALLSFFTPIISSIILFFELLAKEGLYNNFNLLLLFFFICLAFMGIGAFLGKDV